MFPGFKSLLDKNCLQELRKKKSNTSNIPSEQEEIDGIQSGRTISLFITWEGDTPSVCNISFRALISAVFDAAKLV